jgi:ribonucleoside-triphosphate reductase
MNQPFRGGLQSEFYNISIYDDEFLKSMREDYLFPDGSYPDLDLVRELQDLFVYLMNETLRVTTPTFPVTTLCLCVDENKNIKDQDFLKHMCEKNTEFGFMNIYAGTTGTLSSCCRLRSDKSNEYIGYTNSFGGASSQIGLII